MSNTYPTAALEQAKGSALEWLEANTDGYPRSWDEEARDEARRGYATYDDFEAPPIAGYEELEREGKAVRLETVIRGDSQERIHFRLATPAQEPKP